MYLSKSPAIAARLLGDETIIMSTVDSTLFSLNDTGSVIWEAADGITPFSSIVEEKVCAAFEVAPPRAYADAELFVNSLVEHGILLVSDQPFPRTEAL